MPSRRGFQPKRKGIVPACRVCFVSSHGPPFRQRSLLRKQRGLIVVGAGS
jgi:hypothetical protein